jgi:hypothetical protein
MRVGVEWVISLGSLEWGTMEVGSADLEEMATLERFRCELIHQNGGEDSFHAVDGRAGGAAPEKGIITSNSQKTLVVVEDATFG